MTDIAALGVVVKYAGVVESTKALKDLSVAADKVSDSFDRLGDTVDGVGDEFEKVPPKVKPVVDELGRKGPKANDAYSKSLSSLVGSLKTAAIQFAAMTGAIMGVQQVIGVIAEFETGMSKVAAISRATGEDLVELRKVAREMGATTKFSAGEAADAMSFLAMAGYTAKQSIAAIPGVLDLAAASGMGLAETADIATNIMSGFGYEASRSAEVADLLAAASSRTNTDVTQLGEAMKYAAPIARSLGITMEETAALIGVVSDAGIQGSQAGTGLRGVMASLAKPTTQAAKALKQMGINVKDVNPATNDMVSILERFADAGLNAEYAMAIFGRESSSAALAMVDARSKGKDLIETFKDIDGEARTMSKTMTDNLAGDFDELSSAIEDIIIGLGDAGVTGALRGTVQAMESAALFVGSFTQHLGTATYAVGVLALAIGNGLIVQGVRWIGTSVGMIATMGAQAGAAGVLTGALGLLRGAYAALGGPVGLAILAAGGAMYYMFQQSEKADAAVRRYEEAIRGAGNASVIGARGIEEASRSFNQLARFASEAERQLALTQAKKDLRDFEQKLKGSLAFLSNTRFFGDSALSADIQTMIKEFMNGDKSAEELRLAIDGISLANPDFAKHIPGLQALIKNVAAARGEFEGLNKQMFGPDLPSGFAAPAATASDVPTLPSLDTGRGSGSSGAKKDVYKDLLKEGKERIEQLQLETKLVGQYGVSADVARMKLEQLQKAEREGITLSQAQQKELGALADKYGEVSKELSALELMEKARLDRGAIGMSAIGNQIVNDLRNAGIELDSVAGQAYASYVKMTDALSTAKGVAKDFASGFIGDLLRGESAMKALTNAVSKLADKLIDLALNSAIESLFGNIIGAFGGGGSGGGILGSLLGGGGGGFPAAPMGLFAKGGISNEPAIFGEAGAEAAVPLPDGRSIPVTLSQPRQTQQDNGPMHVTIGWSNTADGNLKPFVESVSRDTAAPLVAEGISQFSSHMLPTRVNQISQDPRMRG